MSALMVCTDKECESNNTVTTHWGEFYVTKRDDVEYVICSICGKSQGKLIRNES